MVKTTMSGWLLMCSVHVSITALPFCRAQLMVPGWSPRSRSSFVHANIVWLPPFTTPYTVRPYGSSLAFASSHAAQEIRAPREPEGWRKPYIAGARERHAARVSWGGRARARTVERTLPPHHLALPHDPSRPGAVLRRDLDPLEAGEVPRRLHPLEHQPLEGLGLVPVLEGGCFRITHEMARLCN